MRTYNKAIKITGGDGVRFNADRPKARYFVRTEELGSYAHAMAFWSSGQGGVHRSLCNAAATEQRAAQSDGEHFSFEKEDRVTPVTGTRTAVRSRFSSCSEEAHHRGKLVSFALTADAVLEAQVATSGGADNPIDSDDEGVAAERQAKHEAAVAAALAAGEAAANARAEHMLSLNAKRDAGKARQAADAEAKRKRARKQ